MALFTVGLVRRIETKQVTVNIKLLRCQKEAQDRVEVRIEEEIQYHDVSSKFNE